MPVASPACRHWPMTPASASPHWAGRPECALPAMVANQNPTHATTRICVLVFVRHAADPQPLIAEGEWHGEILDAPRGADGFGYDPLFLVPTLGLTAAELPAEQKNHFSHRGQAMTRLAERLRAGI